MNRPIDILNPVNKKSAFAAGLVEMFHAEIRASGAVIHGLIRGTEVPANTGTVPREGRGFKFNETNAFATPSTAPAYLRQGRLLTSCTMFMDLEMIPDAADDFAFMAVEGSGTDSWDWYMANKRYWRFGNQSGTHQTDSIGGWAYAAGVLSDEKRHIIAVTFEYPGNVSFYVDGRFDVSIAAVGACTDQSREFKIGNNLTYGVGNFPFYSSLIYDRAFTAEEVWHTTQQIKNDYPSLLNRMPMYVPGLFSSVTEVDLSVALANAAATLSANIDVEPEITAGLINAAAVLAGTIDVDNDVSAVLTNAAQIVSGTLEVLDDISSALSSPTPVVSATIDNELEASAALANAAAVVAANIDVEPELSSALSNAAAVVAATIDNELEASVALSNAAAVIAATIDVELEASIALSSPAPVLAGNITTGTNLSAALVNAAAVLAATVDNELETSVALANAAAVIAAVIDNELEASSALTNAAATLAATIDAELEITSSLTIAAQSLAATIAHVSEAQKLETCAGAFTHETAAGAFAIETTDGEFTFETAEGRFLA